MRMRRMAVLAIASALALSACGKDSEEDEGGAAAPAPSAATGVTLEGSPTFDKMTAAGKVVIGVKEDQPNLGFKDPTTGEYSGFDISVAKYIASKLGFGEDKIEFTAIPSANRETAIQGGQIDYYVGTYSITDKRKEQVSFAGPYFIAGQDLLVRKDDTSITGPDSLDGKTVCSVTGSTPLQRIREEYAGAKTIEFQKYSQCVEQMLAGQVDAITTDDAILLGYAAQQPDELKVVGAPFSEEKYGVGLAKDDKVLRDKINDILEEMETSGEWQRAYDATLGQSGSTATPPALERY
ncbi:glutamate ABC transporter substrate-binding protein [Motilibacter aurantiacus]|uniref:glutamate ABC transporter substrate-binding protein n=1 Tax=Motilibacter aurantiacus TaxID=2714955 RepID=UPI00140AB2FD|nr:glutamate ABC transporter substrate-binding protein [Motilibacter aurantiacus]NHC44559.1 glutamate ABC transporter substrate-binding protein [Motilibacter aurantiacus]